MTSSPLRTISPATRVDSRSGMLGRFQKKALMALGRTDSGGACEDLATVAMETWRSLFVAIGNVRFRARREMRSRKMNVERLEERMVLSGPGDIEWVRQFGTAAAATDLARAVDADGNVYVAGMVEATIYGVFGDALVRKYDAAGNELWTRRFGLSNTDTINGLAVDGSAVYVAGTVTGALPGQSSAGSQDAFVRKYDASGTELWTRQFGSSVFTNANAIAVDSSGVYVAGLTNGALPGQTSDGGQDAFVRKYDANGLEIWTRQFGSVVVQYDRATGVSVDSSGVYVVGWTAGALPGQTSVGPIGYRDAFIHKFDISGTELWTRQFGSAVSDEGVAVAADATGVYIAGRAEGALPGQIFRGNVDAFVRKYDGSGVEVWTQQFGTTSTDVAGGIAVGTSGIYVAGTTFGTLPGQISAGGPDVFVSKYSEGGNVLWTRQFGTIGTEQAAAVAIGSSGLYVAGLTNGAFPGQTNSGGIDLLLAKIVDNLAPIADAGGPYAVPEGSTVALNGAGSADPDGAALTYEWDLNYDGVKFSADATGASPTFSAAGLDGDATRTVALRVTDGQGAVSTLAQAQVNVTNVAPTIALAGNPQVNEGSQYTLTLGAITDPGPDTVTHYIIAWGDGMVESFTSPGDKSHTYADDGSQPNKTIKVSLVDEDGTHADVATKSVTVRNVQPSDILVTNGVLTGTGSNATFTATASFSDPGTDTWTATIDYGDTFIQTVALGTSKTFDLSHQYTLSDTYTVIITITDDEGDFFRKRGKTAIVIGTTQSDQINVKAGSIIVEMNGQVPAHLEDIEQVLVWGGDGDDLISVEPAITVPVTLLGGDGNDWLVGGASTVLDGGSGNNLLEDGAGTVTVAQGAFLADGGNVLIVGGTAGDDAIRVIPGTTGTAEVLINGLSYGSFSPTVRVVAHALAGDDDVQVAGGITLPAWLYGGDGHDRLKGGCGNDVLVGGEGDDLLVGQSGRDLLIGGTGADRIVGNADDDILIAGSTTHDNHLAALAAIMDEWTSSRSYSQRIANISNRTIAGTDGSTYASRSNADHFLVVDATVLDDNALDVLTGSAGLDWFFFNADGDAGSTKDKVTDLSASEFAVDLDWIESAG